MNFFPKENLLNIQNFQIIINYYNLITIKITVYLCNKLEKIVCFQYVNLTSVLSSVISDYAFRPLDHSV